MRTRISIPMFCFNFYGYPIWSGLEFDIDDDSCMLGACVKFRFENENCLKIR